MDGWMVFYHPDRERKEQTMSAFSIVSGWERCVMDSLLAGLHGHQARALAHLSWAMAVAGHCQAGKVSVHVPTWAQAASSQRRFERFLSNRGLRAHQAMTQLSRALLRPWTGRRLLLIVDETPKANELRCLKISVAYHKRAIPLVGVCYLHNRLPKPLPKLLYGLLRQVRGCLPPECEVTLLADRGLAWPMVVDWCRHQGWHYVVRLQSSVRLCQEDGREMAVGELLTEPGQRWRGTGLVFKKAGWRPGQVVAVWQKGCREPWLLLTDQPASWRICRAYAKRTWIEEGFRDEKSQGLQWQDSRVNDPAHAERLLLLIALALLLAISLGSELLKRGQRHQLDPKTRRRLSITQMGLRWLRYLLTHDPGRLRINRLCLYPS